MHSPLPRAICKRLQSVRSTIKGLVAFAQLYRMSSKQKPPPDRSGGGFACRTSNPAAGAYAATSTLSAISWKTGIWSKFM